jgi:hypothetical protein
MNGSDVGSNMRSTELYCAEMNGHEGKYLTYFYPHASIVKMCEPDGPIFHVRVSEGPEDIYWGWWDEEDQQFMFIYPAKSLVEMCFPYGSKVEEDRGRGKLLPVRVEILE